MQECCIEILTYPYWYIWDINTNWLYWEAVSIPKWIILFWITSKTAKSVLLNTQQFRQKQNKKAFPNNSYCTSYNWHPLSKKWRLSLLLVDILALKLECMSSHLCLLVQLSQSLPKMKSIPGCRNTCQRISMFKSARDKCFYPPHEVKAWFLGVVALSSSRTWYSRLGFPFSSAGTGTGSFSL